MKYLLPILQLAPGHISLFQHLALNSSPLQRYGLSSSAPEPSDKEQSSVENGGASTNGDSTKSSSDETEESKAANHNYESGSISDRQSTMSRTKRRRVTKRTAFSDSDSEGESTPSYDDLVKLTTEKEELLKLKHKEIETMQDKVLRSYAEMENVMDRTRREAENSKKFAIQVSFCDISPSFVSSLYIQLHSFITVIWSVLEVLIRLMLKIML